MKDDLLQELLTFDQDEDFEKITFEQEDEILEPLLEELELIEDSSVRYFVRAILLKANKEFWSIPTSEDHPKDEHGRGGLLLHSKRVVRAVLTLAIAQERSQYEIDMLIAAAILHDVTHTDGPFHPYTVNKLISDTYEFDLKYGEDTNRSSTLYLDESVIEIISRLIRCSHGKWSLVPETVPITSLDWTLHFADAIATKLEWIWNGDR